MEQETAHIREQIERQAVGAAGCEAGRGRQILELAKWRKPCELGIWLPRRVSPCWRSCRHKYSTSLWPCRTELPQEGNRKFYCMT